MNKFTEQNKGVTKNNTQTKTTKDNSMIDMSAIKQPLKSIATDKAKIVAKPSEQAKAPKKDAFNGKWQSQIQAAKSNWSKISESELRQSGGIETNLTELVQQRYSLSHDVASKQVRSFIDKCHC